MAPEFPLRILSSDGSCEEIASPEELIESIDSIDSDDPAIWVRDALDRTVRLRMRPGAVEVMEVEGVAGPHTA